MSADGIHGNTEKVRNIYDYNDLKQLKHYLDRGNFGKFQNGPP